MNSEKQSTDSAPLTPVQVVKGDWKAFVDKISQKGIVGNMPFIAFLAALCIFYIGNNHLSVQLQRELNAKHKKLKELRWKSMDIRSQMMSKEMESQMIKDAQLIGLRPLHQPTFKIIVDSNTAKGK